MNRKKPNSSVIFAVSHLFFLLPSSLGSSRLLNAILRSCYSFLSEIQKFSCNDRFSFNGNSVLDRFLLRIALTEISTLLIHVTYVIRLMPYICVLHHWTKCSGSRSGGVVPRASRGFGSVSPRRASCTQICSILREI
jgi:hypothetical protein